MGLVGMVMWKNYPTVLASSHGKNAAAHLTVAMFKLLGLEKPPQDLNSSPFANPASHCLIGLKPLLEV